MISPFLYEALLLVIAGIVVQCLGAFLHKVDIDLVIVAVIDSDTRIFVTRFSLVAFAASLLFHNHSG